MRLRVLPVAPVAAALMVLAAVVPAPSVAMPVPGSPGPPTPLDGTPICGVASPPPGSHAAGDEGELRVATFNVLHSDTDDGDSSLGLRLDLLADAIARSEADVVGAQEVTRNATYVPGAEAPQKHGMVAERLAQAVANRTGDAWEWCWSRSNPHVPLTPDVQPGGGNPVDDLAASHGNAPDPGDFSEGLAVLSRYPIEASRFRRLTPRSYEAVACLSPDPFCRLSATFDSRQVLWARIAMPAGELDVFTTHLAHGITPLSGTTQLLQARQALAVTEGWAIDDPLPDVFVGDFNNAPGSAVLTAVIEAGFVDTYAEGGGVECHEPGDRGCSGGPPDGNEVYGTSPQRPMSERIDYVFARPPARCLLEVTSTSPIGNRAKRLPDGRWLWPSDHLGFVSALRCH